MPVSITSQKSNQASIAQSVDNYKLDGLEKPKIPFRNIVAVIGSFAASTMFAARCVLSVAIVAMVSSNSEIVSSNDDNSTVVETISFKKTYDFTNAQQGMILGSYFYTYAAFQIAGGIVADKLDVVWLNIITHSLSAVASFLTPYAAGLGTAAFVILRMFMGATHVTMLATLFTLFANWFPPNEMSIPICLVMGASNLGIAMIMPLTAWMSENESLGGWPMGFFTIGVIEATVPVLFFFFITASPQDSRFVSEYEKRYIAKENSGSVGSKSDIKIKWTQILRSPPVWAIILAKCGIAFGYMMINIKIPAYMEDQLNISLKDNGLLNASMYIILFFAQIASAPSSKYLIEKEILSPTIVRKIFESIALILPAIALFAIPFLGDFKSGVIVALFIAMFALGANTGGDMPLVSEVAPDIAGTLFGVTNTMASAMGIGAPMLSALLLESGLEKSTAWNLTFFFGGAIMILSNIFFIFFATTLPQSWGLSQNRYKNALSAVMADPGSRRMKPYVIGPDGKPPIAITRFSVAY